ncbi:LuxR C-terminal-related transcriptional regulator [Bifidobacterium vansinderenii]|uniref:DNA-binding response regulator n=1 Tax=Bifidobacterium vansinderenii TaxID=1984871 RepID=A0A229VVG6_9BIFI|nr:response regulator transcription factor [Bifidobacterium vansinderenii]OXM99613.1 DNA-binding response regulator [Bifidobacterium vansinderenii]
MTQAAQPNQPTTTGVAPSEPSAGRSVRIGVVDDHDLFRAGVIAAITGGSDDIEIVGQAGDVESSVRMIAETQPDVVLLDVHVPGGEGGGGSEIILRSVPYAPHTLYLALSVSDSPADVGAVIRAGARGYVTKTITAQDLIASIHQVAEGYAVFSPKLAGFVLNALGPGSPQNGGAGAAAGGVGGGMGGQTNADYNPYATQSPNQAPAPVPDDDIDIDVLSPREQEVMRLIARGYSYKEVAAELFISVKTVETHVSKVLRKLQLSNRGELARWAAYRRIV